MSRWLSEELAVINDINALVRFPFPSSYLKHLINLALGLDENSPNSWQTNQLVWPLIEVLPELLKTKEATPLLRWLEKYPTKSGHLNIETWKLAFSIAEALDSYALYRPNEIERWQSFENNDLHKINELPEHLRWQPIIMRMLSDRIQSEPFGLQVKKVIKKLKAGESPIKQLPKELHVFGISSLAPIQVELIQALSSLININIYLLTPCPDLWQRCKARRTSLGDAWTQPLEGEWFLKSPRLEATFGRMGADFQQILEGTGESQLGVVKEGDLFAAPANISLSKNQEPTLLEQIQQNLVKSDSKTKFKRKKDDTSLLFLACPGPWREVQLVRDQILQWLAEDPSLQPRDILIMTPQIKRLAPLINSVFSDISTTEVNMPWRITDRSEKEKPGVTQFIIKILDIAASRLTASSLKELIDNPVIQKQHGISQQEAIDITNLLQKIGFRWGLDETERHGHETHSLNWCLDRLLLGTILPSQPGFAHNGVAPFSHNIELIQLKKWWHLLSGLSGRLEKLRIAYTCNNWVVILKDTIEELFDGYVECEWECQSFLTTLEEWKEYSKNCTLKIEAAVVSDLLSNALSKESGRFGHRSGKLTISALEPMRAIPHRIIVLMGLDSGFFPRHYERPSFHLLEQKNMLGDPKHSDRDRYSILEAIMSARKKLMITWNNRNETTGEIKQVSTPIQQLIGIIKDSLGEEEFIGVIREAPPNPLDRRNFLKVNGLPPLSCDSRNLQARLLLDKEIKPEPLGLALPIKWTSPETNDFTKVSYEVLNNWIKSPQLTWLKQLEINPRELYEEIEDFEALKLNELERYELLRKQLRHELNKDSIEEEIFTRILTSDDWASNYSGTGIIPPKSAGILETELLNNRWSSLIAKVRDLGPCKIKQIKLEQNMKEVLFCNDIALQIQPGKLKSGNVLEGWLRHLYICTSEIPIKQSVIISRCGAKAKKDQFEIAVRWKALKSKDALSILKHLKTITNQGLTTCWPIPPESGWALVKRRLKDKKKGEIAFKQIWDGGFGIKGEKLKPEMQVSFGYNCKAAKILKSEGFEEALESLYLPLTNSLLM